MDRVIVLCSGGLNSTVLTGLVTQENEVALLHARLRLRTSDRDLAGFEFISRHYHVNNRLVLDMPQFAAIGGNARVDASREIEPVSTAAEGVSASYIPGLVGGLLNAAVSWAHVIGASKICIGTVEHLGAPGPRTSSIWPDYSREFIYQWNGLTDTTAGRRPISIDAPLIDMRRADIVQLGRHLSVPLDHTWSCLVSTIEPCSACLGCVTRTRGFLDAGIPDPTFAEALAAV